MIALDTGDKLRAYASVADKIDYTVHGMVNDDVGQLSDGQLAGAEADIYIAPSDAGVMATLIFVNTHNATITCNLYFKSSGGTSRRIIPKDTSIGAGYSLHYDGIRLEINDEKGNVVFYEEGDTVAAPSGYATLGRQADNTLSALLLDASRHLQVDIVGALPAGSAAIGKLAANSGIDIGDVDVASQPVDTFVAEGGALGKGVLLQGDDGVDRHNVAVDASGNVQVDIVGALPAGSAAIGKLAANSGVDIGDVDVASLPALVAGSAKIGSVDVGKKSGTWSCIVVNISTATTTELKAGVAGHTYTVLTISLTIAAENNLTWKSAANAISGPMDFGAAGEPHGWQANLWPCGLKCVAGEALQLTTTTTGQVSGFIAILDES